MERHEILNRLAMVVDAKTYLEIGVESGNTFREIGIASKTGVDPDLKTDPTSLGGTFVSDTSDNFFCRHPSEGVQFDVVFIDGLHTFEQSLRDFLNAMRVLSARGVIVLDDVYPSDHIAALRDHRRCRLLKEKLGARDRNWMGDVFKTVAFIRDFLPEMSYASCGIGHHVSVVWRDTPRSHATLFPDMLSISRMDYTELLENSQVLNCMSLDKIEMCIAARRID